MANKPTPTKPVEPKKETAKDLATPALPEGTVAVEKTLLEAILARQEEQKKEFEEKIAKLEKTNEMLMSVADKSRLARFAETSDVTLIPRANIAEWQGQVVIGWSNLKQRTHWLNGIPQVEQIATVFLQTDKPEEPEQKEMDYWMFWRDIVRLAGDITAKSETKYGKTYTIQLDDGRIVQIAETFINP